MKKTAERLTGMGRPDLRQAQDRVRARRPGTWMFKDDGLVPNSPSWPVVRYRSAVALKEAPDPAAVFEALFAAHGWKDSWRDIVYGYLHYHSDQHEVLGFARGHALLRIGGSKHGRKLELKAGDVLILPAGTGHQSLSASDDLLVVGAYPRKGGYDMCRPTKTDHDRAARAIANTPRPKADPVYGADGPLMRLWR